VRRDIGRVGPSLGLERPREPIASVGRDEGVEVIGDLLRRAVIPSRVAGPPDPR
jgi:hypothetical protein